MHLTATQEFEAITDIEEIVDEFNISFNDLMDYMYNVAEWHEDTYGEENLKDVLWKPDGNPTTASDIKNLYLQEYQSDWFDIDWDEMEDIDSVAEDF